MYHHNIESFDSQSFDMTLVVHHHQTLVWRGVHFAGFLPVRWAFSYRPSHMPPQAVQTNTPHETPMNLFAANALIRHSFQANHEEVCSAKINGCLTVVLDVLLGRFDWNDSTNRTNPGGRNNSTKTYISNAGRSQNAMNQDLLA